LRDRRDGTCSAADDVDLYRGDGPTDGTITEHR
jgi:hypothetical protein